MRAESIYSKGTHKEVHTELQIYWQTIGEKKEIQGRWSDFSLANSEHKRLIAFSYLRHRNPTIKPYQKFEQHCIPCKNETHEVCAFNQGTEECEIMEGVVINLSQFCKSN